VEVTKYERRKSPLPQFTDTAQTTKFDSINHAFPGRWNTLVHNVSRDLRERLTNGYGSEDLLQSDMDTDELEKLICMPVQETLLLWK
jgi:hypothetical protein